MFLHKFNKNKTMPTFYLCSQTCFKGHAHAFLHSFLCFKDLILIGASVKKNMEQADEELKALMNGKDFCCVCVLVLCNNEIETNFLQDLHIIPSIE